MGKLHKCLGIERGAAMPRRKRLQYIHIYIYISNVMCDVTWATPENCQCINTRDMMCIYGTMHLILVLLRAWCQNWVGARR